MSVDPNQERTYIVKLGGFGVVKRVAQSHKIDIYSLQMQQLRDSWPLTASVFKQNVYDFGFVCNKILFGECI